MAAPDAIPRPSAPVGSPAPDWPALERLRTAFLTGNAGESDYWRQPSDLASYDATFAQRIGWKWDFVLTGLEAAGWTPPVAPVVDWGCGSGIAARAWLDFWGTGAASGVQFWDRSPLAMKFAADRARQKYPGLGVVGGVPAVPGTVLLSHVLTELRPDQLDPLLTWLAGAGTIVWVEPGNREAGHALVSVRERLREQFHVVAPCPHGGNCGLLAPGREADWCHHFAPSPPAVYTDPFWGRFAALAGVDLRSLPVSYLVLDRRAPAPLPSGTVRVIGRPRVFKAHAAVLACDAAGVEEWDLRKRDLPGPFRRLRKGDCPSLQVWRREGRWVVEVRDHPVPPGTPDEVAGPAIIP